MARPGGTFVVTTLALASLSMGLFAEAPVGQQVGARQNTAQVTASAPAPTGSGLILGRVVDGTTNQPITGASVTLNVPVAGDILGGRSGPPPASRTNGDGYFLFRDLPKGTFPLTAQAPGYLPGSAGRRRPDGPSLPVTLEPDQHATDIVIRMWKYGSITGMVVDEAGEPSVGTAVRIVQRTAGGRLSLGVPVQTDDRGVYRVASLTPGDYLVVVPSSTTSVPASFADALRGASAATLTALSRDLPAGVSTLALGRGVGEGARVGDNVLQPSTLLGNALVAPQPDASGPFLAYPTVFHPSAATPNSATVVRVESGRELSGVDIRLRLTPTLRVAGVVTNPGGAVGNMGLRLVPTYVDTFGNDGNLDASSTVVATDGRFTFLGVTPGQYHLKALRIPRPIAQGMNFQTVINYGDGGTLMMGGGTPALPPAPTEPTLWADVPIDVTDRDVADVPVVLRTGARASGRVVFEDDPQPALAESSRFGVGLTPADERSVQIPQPAPVDANLMFRTAEYPGGRYVFTVSGMPSGWTVKSAMVRDVDANLRPVNLTDDVSDVVVTLTTRIGEISGTVRKPGTTGDPAAMVFVFPADHQAWIQDGLPGRRVRTAAVRQDGTFRVAGLGAGDYVTVAVPDERNVDMRDPATVTALARAATRVTLTLGEKKTIALTVSQTR